MPVVLKRPTPEPPKYICIACEDTGKNSRGGDCAPCVANGRIVQSVPQSRRVTVRVCEIKEEDLFK